MAFVLSYLVCLIVFTVIDGLWLGLVAKAFYSRQLARLMRDRVAFVPAALFYLLYPAAITLLAVQPALSAGSVQYAGALGIVVGLTAYGTYNFTNMATLRHWPTAMSVVDLAWGAFMTGAVAALSAYALLGLGFR